LLLAVDPLGDVVLLAVDPLGDVVLLAVDPLGDVAFPVLLLAVDPLGDVALFTCVGPPVDVAFPVLLLSCRAFAILLLSIPDVIFSIDPLCCGPGFGAWAGGSSGGIPQVSTEVHLSLCF
jgi:hypothetical protein